MKPTHYPTHAYYTIILRILRNGRATTYRDIKFTFEYVPAKNMHQGHELYLVHPNPSTVPSWDDNGVVRESLLMALRQLAREGGPVVILYPRITQNVKVGNTRGTRFRWQMARTADLFQLSPEQRRVMLNWKAHMQQESKRDLDWLKNPN